MDQLESTKKTKRGKLTSKSREQLLAYIYNLKLQNRKLKKELSKSKFDLILPTGYYLNDESTSADKKMYKIEKTKKKSFWKWW